MKKISDTIHKDFPLLRDTSLVYLDSAATSQTPQPVVDAIENYYTQYRASIHRGLYPIAERTTDQYEDAREKTADLIGAEKEEIIFTSGATASSNMLIYSLEQSLDLREGDEIVTTVMEHHAALLPLQEFAKRNKLSIKYIPLTKQLRLDHAAARKLISKKTKIVSVMLSSNVLGTINDISFFSVLAKKVGAVMITDATAAVGHIPVDVKELNVDFLFFSGHKMCGPTGTGVLYGKKEVLEDIKPSFFGGGMINSVACDKEATWAKDMSRFEAGTPNIAGVIGLGSAIDYIQCLDLERIHTEVVEILSYAIETLSNISGVCVYCEKDVDKNIGTVSFTVDGIHPHDVAQIAGQNNIAVRAGHHCAMPLVKELGVNATVRASLYFYNTKKDIDALCEVVQKAKEIFKIV
ncbi:MAG: cysteine desulfurase [Candidatus Pacebacteria bacterium]|nr:cysteine desulfurase [Candidatus Paceibacterota bacterium]